MVGVVRARMPGTRPFLGGRGGIPVTVDWLRRGLAMFLWASNRSLASFHGLAASSLGADTIPGRISDAVRYRLVGSFVQYLFERQGIDRLRRFFERADRVGIESAARDAFGKGFFELELEWELMLRALER